MPTYEYQCKACQHEFEREQRITEDPIKACPSCGAPQARRLISRTSFVLKGGGWYSDLYSSKGPGKDSGGGAAKPDAPKPDSSKGDSAAKSPSSDKGSSDKGSSSAKGTGGAQAAA